MKLPAALLLALLLGHAALAGDETGPFGNEWKRQYEPEDDAWKSVPQDLIFNNGSEPETLDPAVMTGVPEHTLALALYEGLTSHDPETLEPRPGVASSWEISDDAKTYTFYLRRDAKFSNGDPVTAEDFAWSWYRAIFNVNCQYAYLFYYIKGVEEFHEPFSRTGVRPARDVFDAAAGVKVVDAHTLVVTLVAPTAYFLDLCAFETYMPVHRKTVEKHGDRWTLPGTWVGNGPFLLKEWSPRLHIVMTPNPKYWDAGTVKLTSITALPTDDIDVSYNKFVKGEVHWIKTVPIAKLDEAKRKAEYFAQPYLGSYFYRVNVGNKNPRPHLQNKKVRRALSMSINRESITRDVTRAGQIPAGYFCPPIRSAGYTPVDGLPYDPEKARALLKEGLAELGIKELPRITIYYNTSEDHKKVAERIAQMWKENLGINVALQNNEWKVYLEEVVQENYDIARAGWIGDYGDPMTFMDMWLTDGGNNNTGWSNARYDELIGKARVEPDPAKRVAYFHEAEKLLVEDEFPILPLYIYVNQGMKVEGLQGWYENIRDLHPFQYMYFEPE